MALTIPEWFVKSSLSPEKCVGLKVGWKSVLPENMEAVGDIFSGYGQLILWSD